jgi:hypothetical protein
MTDERLAEIEEFVLKQDWQPEGDIICDLIAAIREEKQKVAELQKDVGELHSKYCKLSIKYINLKRR